MERLIRERPAAVPLGLRPLQGAARGAPLGAETAQHAGTTDDPLGARLLLGLLWLLHWLPLGVQAAIGRGLGRLLHALAGSRRRIALRNLELCFPEQTEPSARALVREHFRWLGRSLLERGLLWYASPRAAEAADPRRRRRRRSPSAASAR